MPQSPRRRDSPYLQQHADNPVDWYPWGEEALARARAEGQADPAVDRLLGVPLVPRDGARVVRGPGRRRGDERRVRQHQGRPRGASRPRPDLPDRARAADAPLGRLAAHDVPDAGGRAVLRRHLLPEARALRPAGLSRSPAAGRRGVSRAGRRRSPSRAGGSPRRCEALEPGRRRDALPRAARRRVALAGLKRTLRSRCTAASAARPSFRIRPSSSSACARARSRGDAEALDDRAHDARRAWPTAASTTSSAAASAATASTPSGRSRTSRRCSTTTGRCSRCTPISARVDRRDARYADVARDIVGWLVREMRAHDGAFYSSLDADSEGEEGKFYVWTRDEARAALSRRRMGGRRAVLRPRRPAQLRGPRVEPARRRRRSTQVARALGITLPDAQTRLAGARAALFAARETRVRPGRDDKILTSWNALAIAGPRARGARARRAALGRPRVRRGRRAASAPRGATAGSSRRAAATAPHLNAYLDDHAFLLAALIELMQTRFRREDFDWARELADALLERFEDRERGGFFFTSHDHERCSTAPSPATTTRRRRATASPRRR